MKRLFGGAAWKHISTASTSTTSKALHGPCPTCGSEAAPRTVDCFAPSAGRGISGGGSAAAPGATGPANASRMGKLPVRSSASGQAVSTGTCQSMLQQAAHTATAHHQGWTMSKKLVAVACGGVLCMGAVSQAFGVIKTDEFAAPRLTFPAGIPPGLFSSQPSPAGVLSPYFIADAAAKAAPAVVNISVRDIMRSEDDAANGSGFIISSDGVIVTNTHIIADAIPLGNSRAGVQNSLIQCTLQDGRCFQAELLNYDWQSDLAVLRIQAATTLPVAKLGRSAALRVGEWVLALGSPLHLSNSVSAGIVSAVERKGAELGMDGAPTDYIQTDAAVNIGSSGGPLVNVQGEVIGISNMKALAADGVSFAIPIDTARHVVDQLLSPAGRVTRPYIGAKLMQLSPAMADELRAANPSSPGIVGGIYVPYVHPASPAEKAGLLPGDVITGFPGAGVTMSGLTQALGQNIGKPLPVQVARRGVPTLTLQIVATEASANSA